MASLSVQRRAVLRRAVRWIVAATICWNVIEGAVALVAGAGSSSIALIGFGLDSGIEVLSAVAVAWQFSRPDPERWERPTLRVIAVAFFALAAWVIVGAVLALAGVVRAEPSFVGIVLAAVSVVVMPALSALEFRIGRALGSATVVADSRQTLLCAALSLAVLVGLALNALVGWWWADAVAALVIAAFAVREGVEAWRGDTCTTPIGIVVDDDHGDPLGGDDHDHDQPRAGAAHR